MTTGWRTCAICWDWIWPAEQVYTDARGRTPVCAVCHVRQRLGVVIEIPHNRKISNEKEINRKRDTGMSDDLDLLDEICDYSDAAYERGVAAGRVEHPAAEDLFEMLRAAGVYAVHTPDGVYQLADVAFAVSTADIAEGAPAEPVEEGTDD